jgi:hypothetical protein
VARNAPGFTSTTITTPISQERRRHAAHTEEPCFNIAGQTEKQAKEGGLVRSSGQLMTSRRPTAQSIAATVFSNR